MKKNLFAILITLVAILAVGCANMTVAGKPDTTIDRIQKRGTVNVGTAANMPPLNMMTKGGVPAGLDVDLAQAIAGAMGVELKLVIKNFAELLPALEAGEVDMVISGMTITPGRNLKVDFAGPYHITGKSYLTKVAAIAKITDPKELNSMKFHFTALAGSTSEQLVKELMPSAKYTPVNKYDDGVAMVLNDQVDAMVSDYHACLVAALRNPDAGLVTLISRFTYEPLGIALPAGDAHLLNWMDNFIGTMVETGTLGAFKIKWLEDAGWLYDRP
ncbi:MAG: transporter substrate-binding domain-containing protein [Desulfatitalea sp.]|nr:transporter substrate-binding domain-containing protein [Desulfatitalea sp.]NNK01544.1 transporter substrate-binding domain-containing protein [Desulfatitalea sp.]